MIKVEDHHYVPQFLLRNWARGGRATVWRRIPHNNKLEKADRATKGFGKLPNLYSLEGVTEDRVQFIEKQVFGKIESDANLVLKILLGGAQRELSPTHRISWARFLNTFFFRHPQELDGLRTTVAQLIERLFIENNVKDGHQAFNSHRPSYLPNLHKELMTDLIRSEKLTSALLRMHWNVLSVENAPFTLLVGDRPLVKLGLSANALAFWALPIDRKHLFVAADPRQARRIASISPIVLARSANMAIAKSASDFVCGEACGSFIAKYFTGPIQ